MQIFVYKAYSSQGEHKTGKIEALDEGDANQKLTALGFSPYSVNQSRNSAGFFSFENSIGKRKEKLTDKESSSFYSGLAVLFDSGFMLDDALLLVQKIEASKKLRACYSSVRSNTSQGQSFAESLEQSLETPPHVAAIFASSEASGTLNHALRQVASDFNERQKIREEIQQALTYPIFLICLLIVVLTLLSIQLVPALEPIFSGNDAQMPVIIQLLLDAGTFLSKHSLVIAGSLVVSAAIVLIRPSRQWVGHVAHAFARQLPLFGSFLRRATGARYLRTLALLTENNVPLKDSLTLSARGVSNNRDRQQFEEVARFVGEGESLSDALGRTNLLADYVLSLISIGEESDNLAQMVLQGSQIEERRVRGSISTILNALSPTLTILIGVIVGGVVVSVMSALLNLNDVVLR